MFTLRQQTFDAIIFFPPFEKKTIKDNTKFKINKNAFSCMCVCVCGKQKYRRCKFKFIYSQEINSTWNTNKSELHYLLKKNNTAGEMSNFLLNNINYYQGNIKKLWGISNTSYPYTFIWYSYLSILSKNNYSIMININCYQSDIYYTSYPYTFIRYSSLSIFSKKKKWENLLWII